MESIDDLLNQPAEPRRSGISLGSIVLILGIVMVIAVVGLQLRSQLAGQPERGPAPDFIVTTYNGETFDLSDQRGNVVVLNFWGSWCAPCRTEAPGLQAIYERYRDRGVTFIGVTWLDERPDALAFIEEFSLTFPSGPDTGLRISDAYGITGAPETFVIDQDGNVAASFLGPLSEDGPLKFSDLTGALDDLLADEAG
jgi:cytochrome c biogenesis protein CcmG/thiol:disulfide interchange protein DsbE